MEQKERASSHGARQANRPPPPTSKFPVRLPFDLPAAAMLPKSIQRVAAAAANASSSSAVVFASVDDSASAAREASIPSCSSSNAASPVSSSETVISDDVDYSLHANIEAFFLSPKCMEYTMMEPCSAFFAPPLAMAMEECCWEEEGDIALWSFSSLD